MKYTLSIVRVNDAAVRVETRESLIRVSFGEPRAAAPEHRRNNEPPASKLVLPVTHVQVGCGARRSLGSLV